MHAFCGGSVTETSAGGFLGIAFCALGSDSYPMKRFTSLLAVFVVILAGSAYGNVLNDLVGTWRVTTRWVENGRELTKSSVSVVNRISGGGVHVVNSERLNGKQVVVSREWLIPGGTCFVVNYDEDGTTGMLGHGTWKVSGNTVSGSYGFLTLEGRFSLSAKATRSNRNRWTQTTRAWDDSFSVTATHTMVRTK